MATDTARTATQFKGISEEYKERNQLRAYRDVKPMEQKTPPDLPPYAFVWNHIGSAMAELGLANLDGCAQHLEYALQRLKEYRDGKL